MLFKAQPRHANGSASQLASNKACRSTSLIPACIKLRSSLFISAHKPASFTCWTTTANCVRDSSMSFCCLAASHLSIAKASNSGGGSTRAFKKKYLRIENLRMTAAASGGPFFLNSENILGAQSYYETKDLLDHFLTGKLLY